jgi:DNA-binding PadR family transcriptional regulator
LKSSKTLTPLALAALEVLHEGPHHPYEIHQTMLERKMDRLVKLSPGTLYHTIERLDRDGFVQVVETTREGKRPERTTYRLTDAGRDAFAERLRHLIATVAEEYPSFSVAVELMHTLDQEDAVRQLRVRALDLEARLAALDVACVHLADMDLHPLFWPDIRLRHKLVATELDWVTDLIAQLDSGVLSWPVGEGAGTAGVTETRPASDEPHEPALIEETR